MAVINKLAVTANLAEDELAVQVCLYIKVSIAENILGKHQIHPIFSNNAPHLSSKPSIDCIPPRTPIAIDDPLHQAHLLLNLSSNATSTRDTSSCSPAPTIDVDQHRARINILIPSQRSTPTSNPQPTRSPPVAMENETRRSLGGGTPSPRSESSKSRNEYVVCLRYMIQVKGDADCDDDVVAVIPLPRCLQNRLILSLKSSSAHSGDSAAALDPQIVTSPKVTWLSESKWSQQNVSQTDGGYLDLDGTFPSTSMLELRWKDARLASHARSTLFDPSSPLTSTAYPASDFLQILSCHTDATLVFKVSSISGEKSSLIMESMSALHTGRMLNRKLLMEMNVPDGFRFEVLHVKQRVVHPTSGVETTHDVVVEMASDSLALTPQKQRPASTSPASIEPSTRRLSHGRKSSATTGAQASLLRLQLPPMQSDDCSFEASILMDSPNDEDLEVVEEGEVERVLGINIDSMVTPVREKRELAAKTLGGSQFRSETPQGEQLPGGMRFVLNIPQRTEGTPVILIMQTVFSKIHEMFLDGSSPHTANVPIFNFPKAPKHDFDLVVANLPQSFSGSNLWKLELIPSPSDEDRLASAEVCHITMSSRTDVKMPMFTLHPSPATSEECIPAKPRHRRLPDTPKNPASKIELDVELDVDGSVHSGQTTPIEDVFGSKSERMHIRRSVPESWNRRRVGPTDRDAKPELHSTQQFSSASNLLTDFHVTSVSDRQRPNEAPVFEAATDVHFPPEQRYKTWMIGFLCGIFAVLAIQSSYHQADRLRSLGEDSRWLHLDEQDLFWHAPEVTEMDGVVGTAPTITAVGQHPTDSSLSVTNFEQQDVIHTDQQRLRMTCSSPPRGDISAVTTTLNFTHAISTHYALWAEVSTCLTRLLHTLRRYNPFYWIIG